MAKKKADLPDELNQTIYAQLFPAQPSKADRRKIEILDAAVRTYASLSVDYVGYEDIAKNAKTSRPLVIHHFPSKEDLFALAVRFIRAGMQEIAVSEMSRAKPDAVSRLNAYVGSTFIWLENQPVNMKAWLFHFYICSSDPKFRDAHRELTEMGAKRIVSLLNQGAVEGVFPSKALHAKAKTIQRLITGGLIEAISELGPERWPTLSKACVQDCLAIAKS